MAGGAKGHSCPWRVSLSPSVALGMEEAPCEEGGDSAAVMELLQQREEGRTNFSLRCTRDRKVTVGVTMLAVALLLTVTIIALAAKKHPPCTAPTLPSCLEGGIGFGNKCFYFLEEEVDWEGSQHSCLSHQAHLATIDTREELHFLLRYGNFMEYWVGLRREGSGPWKWLNGSLFNALYVPASGEQKVAWAEPGWWLDAGGTRRSKSNEV